MEQNQDQITPSSSEQVQVVAGQPAAVVTSDAQPSQEPAAPISPEAKPVGYDNYTDDDFKNAYKALCVQMGREFGVRHELITDTNIVDITKFKNVLIVVKTE